LPYDFGTYAAKLREFVNEVQKKPGAEQHLELKPLMNAVAEFEKQGDALNRTIEQKLPESTASKNFDGVNTSIMAVERNWLHPEGIPGRPWFKHLLYAARYTYAHLELPGLTEAVEKGDWKTATEQARILEDAARKNAALLKEAAGSLSQPKGN